MCTVIALKGVRDDYPLVIAANRDEFYARPSTGPKVVREASPRVVAGVDLESGGTWMGANDAGVFVSLTNQRQYEGADETLASRGEIVMDALAHDSVEDVDLLIESIDPRAYNAFNLMYGDAGTLKVAYSRHSRPRIEIEALGDGVWVLPNDRIGSAEFPKAQRAHALVEPHRSASFEALVEHLKDALADHELPPKEEVPVPPPGSRFTHDLVQRLQALCIHTPLYGTRSSTLLALSPGRVAHYLFGEGPACVSELVDVTELLR